ncbi:Sodium/calcium exchanger protein-domain-containing protein [Crassisporium funariophilum]|nr:Sodium/calcium exchanger protein-domain-containing protein [Crassisporium funariophilum]
MAQTRATHSLLANSDSIECVHRLPPPAQRSTSHFSSSSLDSGTNFVPQGDFAEASTSQTCLPSFYSFGFRNASPASPNNAGVLRRNALKGWRVILLGSWLNVLLVLIPVSWTLTVVMKESYGLTFGLCILALIPLVRLHDLATQELANRIGGSKTGLLNASMSNFVTIVVAISALRKCELQVVQSSLIGSMLSKLLLVLGLCFFAGGMRFSEQVFDATATQIHSSLLSLSVGAVLLPAAYHFTLSSEGSASTSIQKQNILHMSHGVSIILLFIYVAYLLFQLWSHTHLYGDQHNKKSSRLSSVIREKQARRKRKARPPTLPLGDSQPGRSRATNDPISIPLDPPRRPYASPSPSPLSSTFSSESDITLASPVESTHKSGYVSPGFTTVRLVPEAPLMVGRASVAQGMSRNSAFSSAESSALSSLDERYELQSPALPRTDTADSTLMARKEPELSWVLTILLMVFVTGAVAITVDWLVECMDKISQIISKEWVGLILLPSISSMAECMTAVKVSVKDEVTLSVSVAVGSTIQTALFVIPFTVILAWITNKPLSLLMDPFQSMVLYIAVQTMNYVVADGKSNWLEGVVLICLYIIIAVSFWFYPGSNLPSSLGACTVS